MPAGRPRTVSLPPDEMIKLGEEMIEYIETHDVLHLQEWYGIEKMILDGEWKAMIQIPEFLPYYNKAIKMVAKKYVDKNSNVRDSIAHRFARIYYQDLRQSEDEFVILKAQAGKKALEENIQDLAGALHKAITEYDKLSEADKTVSGARESHKERVETGKPILDKGQAGEQDPVCSQLGTKRVDLRSTSMPNCS